jgi:hypothetical protein
MQSTVGLRVRISFPPAESLLRTDSAAGFKGRSMWGRIRLPIDAVGRHRAFADRHRFHGRHRPLRRPTTNDDAAASDASILNTAGAMPRSRGVGGEPRELTFTRYRQQACNEPATGRQGSKSATMGVPAGNRHRIRRSGGSRWRTRARVLRRVNRPNQATGSNCCACASLCAALADGAAPSRRRAVSSIGFRSPRHPARMGSGLV